MLSIEELDSEGILLPFDASDIGDKASDPRNAAWVFTAMRSQLATLIQDEDLLDRVAYSASLVTLQFQSFTANMISDKVREVLPGKQFVEHHVMDETVAHLVAKRKGEA